MAPRPDHTTTNKTSPTTQLIHEETVKATAIRNMDMTGAMKAVLASNTPINTPQKINMATREDGRSNLNDQ